MLDPQMKRGLLENCVLAILCRGDSYGYQIIKDLSACTEISESTLYPILRRQESAGNLSTYSIAHNGRLRKFYHITEQGRQQLSDFLEGFSEVLRIYQLMQDAAACKDTTEQSGNPIGGNEV